MEYVTYSFSDDLVYFNSQNTKYKSPFGAVFCDSNVTLNIFVSDTLNPSKVYLHLFEDNKDNPHNPKKTILSMNKVENFFTIDITTPAIPNLIFYYFEIIGNQNLFYGNNEQAFGGVGKIYFENPIAYQITTHYKENTVPTWFKESIAYQIFPDRFYNGNKRKNISNPKPNSFIYSNWYDIPMYIKDDKGGIARWDFYGGNLKGIQEKISYIKGLNIDLIYLNPIFEATSNHRYDTGNYLNIDPVLGTKKDFKDLVTSCKKRNINIILDGVFNHTGKDSIYFNRFGNYPNLGAYNSKESPYYEWYEFFKFPNEYRSWWGFSDLPCVNELNPHFFDFVIQNEKSVINTWMSYGIKGWRLDVADELPSYFIESLKFKCKQIDPTSVVLGEVWDEVTTKISYGQRKDYFNGRQLDSVMNYPLRDLLLNFFNNIIDANELSNSMKSIKEKYPRENYYSLFNSLSTHDVPRIKTMIKNCVDKYNIPSEEYDTSVSKVLKSITLMQFTLPGVPVIYYGDEAGLEGWKDPDNRRTYPWKKECDDTLKWYRKITLLRNKSSLLKSGEIEFFTPHSDVFGYIRYFNDSNDFIIIVTNRDPKNSHIFSINLKDILPNISIKRVTDIFQWNNPLITPLDLSTNFPIKIPPLKTLIFSNKRV